MGLFSRKKPEPEKPKEHKWEDLSPAMREFQESIGETKESWERGMKLADDRPQNIALLKSIGTYDMDEILREYAPEHEEMLKQIIQNQQRILTGIAELQRCYNKLENTNGTTYQQPYIK